jgi:hypothetical protein
MHQQQKRETRYMVRTMHTNQEVTVGVAVITLFTVAVIAVAVIAVAVTTH